MRRSSVRPTSDMQTAADTRADPRHHPRAKALALVALSLMLTGCTVQAIRGAGPAMEPTLVNGDRALVSRVFAQLERGDIVGFKYPRNESKRFLMRIVGLPGERIEMTEGVVSINGRTIEEAYVVPEYRSRETWGPHTVPSGEYYVMGDNRKNSADSRTWGTVGSDLIWARVISW